MEVDDDNIVSTDSSRQVCKTFMAMNKDFYRIMFHSLTMERKQVFCSFLQNTNINLNVLNEHGESLLHVSLKCSDEYFLNEVLKTGVSLEQKMYRTILHNAVALNKPSFVEPLLRYGVPMNNEDSRGRTPLGVAIENSNFEIVSMLLYYNCDCDTHLNGYISPFMQSMLCGSAREIQLLLLGYEAEIYYTHLVIAIDKCEYLIPHILNYDVDVNQVCNNRNIIHYIFSHPIQSNIFKMIWEKFDYETWNLTMGEGSILLTMLHLASLPNDLWDEYFRIIIESSKLQTILNCFSPAVISSVVIQYTKRGFVESDFFDIICILLVNDCRVYDTTLHTVYNVLGGASRILNLLIHMDIESLANVMDHNFIRVRYSFDKPISQLLRTFLSKMKIINMTASYKDILRYFTVPPKVKNYLQNYRSVDFPSTITWGQVVPSLLELSRNKSREFICQKFKVKTGSRYCSIVKHYALPEVVKQILMFERPLYFHA